MHGDEQVLAREAGLHLALLGRHLHRVHVLDEERRHLRAVLDVGGIAGEHRADARLVEHAHFRVGDVEALDQRLVPVIDGAIVVEAAAALVQPGAGDRGNAQRGMHVVGAVAGAGEAVAQPEIGARRGAHHLRKGLDLGDGQAGDGAGPLGRARCEMRFQLARAIGVFLEVRPVGEAIAEQHVHDGAGQRAVGARQGRQMQIGQFGGGGAVRIDNNELGAPLAPRLRDVGHHIDLGRGGIAA